MNITFNELIESVDKMPLDEQVLLAEVINKRISENRRNEIIKDVKQSRKDYDEGKVKSGTVADLMKELTS